MSPYLDPLNQALADEFAAQPPLQDLPVKEFRAFFEKLQHPAHRIPGVTRTNFNVPFEGGVKTFIFKSENIHKRSVLPVVLYLHGGAWISGTVNSYDSICRDLALQTECAIVFPEYTLAPEARWPTQQEQCYAVLKWVRENGEEKGLSQEKLAVVGDSAGGQLAVATTILASTREPVIPISYQVLLHPALLNFTAERQDHSEFEFFTGPIITVPFARKTFSMYVPNAHDRKDELAAPINISASHAGLQPPTLIINSAVDLLRSEGNLYGEILQKNGVDCAVLTTHGQVHDSEILEATRTGSTPRASLRLVARSLTEALGTVQDMGKNRKVEGVEQKNGETDGQLKKRKRRAIGGSY